MSASDSWIDKSGGKPTLRPLVAATSVLGTILYGWWAGFQTFVGSAGGGIWGTINAVRRFLADPAIVLDSRGVHPAGVIPWLFAIGANAIEAAAQSNANWLRGLGLVGIFVGFLEGLVLFYLLVWMFKTIVRRLAGGL